MTPNSILLQASDFSTAEIYGEILLYRLGAHKAIHLNETASLIWTLCDGTRTVQAIVEELRDIFPDDALDIAADSQEALSMLIGEGALVELAGIVAPSD
jgi:hypothetical protein